MSPAFAPKITAAKIFFVCGNACCFSGKTSQKFAFDFYFSQVSNNSVVSRKVSSKNTCVVSLRP